MPDEDWNWELPQSSQSSASLDADTPPAANPQHGGDQGQGHGDIAADSDPPRGQDSPRPDMGRTIGFTILGAVLPGTALIAARRRLFGGIVLGVFAVVVLGIGVWAVADTTSLISAAVNPGLLRVVAIVLAVLGLAWIAVIIVGHLAVRGAPMTRPQRFGTNIVVGVLCFLVLVPMGIAARYSYDQAGLVSTVFKSQDHSHSATRPGSDSHGGKHSGKGDGKNPWADKSRVNVLLLGGDAAGDRTGNRTDTVMVASIDTKTGDTTLIGLPRNTARMPFAKNSPLKKYYPHGFTNGDSNDAEYFLNAMYDNVPNKVPDDVLGKTDNLGADAMKLSVGEATGLKLDYYVLINLKGFTELIDALGGITVNINNYVAIGGDTDRHIPPKSYLKPGPDQHLGGKKALWYARGRYGASDYQRMDRQRCTMNAIIDQAHPANVLKRYESIVKAGKKIVKTDIPQEKLSDFVTLGDRVKDGHVRSRVFKNGKKGFHSSHPNFSRMRKQVKQSIGEAKKPPKKSSDKTAKPSSPASSSAPSTPSSSPSSQTRSTKDACAWDREKAAQATKPS